MTMEELLKTAVSQAPGLVVLYFLVLMFLRRDKERDQFIQGLHNEHLAARGESREAIKENTESNRDVSKAIAELSSSVRATKAFNP